MNIVKTSLTPALSATTMRRQIFAFTKGSKVKTMRPVIRFLWRGILVIVSLCCSAEYGFAQNKAKYDFREVDHQLSQWIDSGYYKGLAIIVVKDDHIIHEKYWGNYNDTSVAYIASSGKWLAAATIAAVVDEGKLSWDDPVRKWLPAFSDRKGDATLRQLLSHTAGYPDYQPAGNPPDNYQTLKESVEHVVNLPPDTLPGTRFKYGGLAMQVAGRMAEVATGKSWEQLFREKIAVPLTMPRTHFTPVSPVGGQNPMLGGGARTSLPDYANFLNMIYHKGLFKGRRILSEKAIEALERDQVLQARVGTGEYVEKVKGGHRNDIYGLGEWREEVDGQGHATLISSPSWAGAYPWIDIPNHVYGFVLARIDQQKNGFNPFYESPVVAVMVRRAIINVSP